MGAYKGAEGLEAGGPKGVDIGADIPKGTYAAMRDTSDATAWKKRNAALDACAAALAKRARVLPNGAARDLLAALKMRLAKDPNQNLRKKAAAAAGACGAALGPRDAPALARLVARTKALQALVQERLGAALGGKTINVMGELNLF